MMYIQFRYIKKDKTLKIIFPLNPSKKYLPLPQKYRVYYRLQKEDFMSDFLGQVKYERI